MKAKYIGAEDMPGSKSTVLFGMRVKIDEVFEVPAAFHNKARHNKFVEVVQDDPPPKSDQRQPGKGGIRD